MPLGTLDRTPPPFFKQGPSALSKLMVFSALAMFLMVADLRFQITQPLRSALGLALTPVEWVAMQPVHVARFIGQYFESLSSAQSSESKARAQLALQAARAQQVEQLAQENQQLRQLLELAGGIRASIGSMPRTLAIASECIRRDPAMRCA